MAGLVYTRGVQRVWVRAPPPPFEFTVWYLPELDGPTGPVCASAAGCAPGPGREAHGSVSEFAAGCAPGPALLASREQSCVSNRRVGRVWCAAAAGMHELVELVATMVEYLDAAAADAAVTKADAVEGARERLCGIMQKLVSFPLTTNFSLPCMAHGDALDLSDLAR